MTVMFYKSILVVLLQEPLDIRGAVRLPAVGRGFDAGDQGLDLSMKRLGCFGSAALLLRGLRTGQSGEVTAD